MQAQRMKRERDRKSRESNPCDPLFWTSRGWRERPRDWQDILNESGYYDRNESDSDYDETEYSHIDERTLNSRKQNPCDPIFWKSRGWPRRPDQWKHILEWSGWDDSYQNSDDADDEDELSENTTEDTDDDNGVGDYDDSGDRDDHADSSDDDNDDGDGYNDSGDDDDAEYDSAVDSVENETDEEQNNDEDSNDIYRVDRNDPSTEYFWTSRGWKRRPLNYQDVLERSGYYDSESEDEEEMGNMSNIKSRENNPCDPYFWKSRGWPRRPYNWRTVLEESGYYETLEIDINDGTPITFNEMHFESPDNNNAGAAVNDDDRRHFMLYIAANGNRSLTYVTHRFRRAVAGPAIVPDELLDQLVPTLRRRDPEWTPSGNVIEFTENLPENKRCGSCMINVKNYFLRCGHLICAKCAEHLYNTYGTCPFCRKTIEEEPIQIFMDV